MASHGWYDEHTTYRTTARMRAIAEAERSDSDRVFNLENVENTLKEAEVISMYTNNWLMGSDPDQWEFSHHVRGYRGTVLWVYKDKNNQSMAYLYGPIEKATA